MNLILPLTIDNKAKKIKYQPAILIEVLYEITPNKPRNNDIGTINTEMLIISSNRLFFCINISDGTTSNG
jgi:hypothetical protein